MGILDKLITQEEWAKLRSNNIENCDGSKPEKPVVKLFGGGACTWLLSQYDDEGCFFGLCDLGMGFPKLGYVSKQELEEAKFPPMGLPIEKDRHWRPRMNLEEYADLARREERIIS